MQSVNLEKLPPQARLELLDFYDFLLRRYGIAETFHAEPKTGKNTQPPLGALAVQLFGVKNGIELNLPAHPPHEPLELGS